MGLLMIPTCPPPNCIGQQLVLVDLSSIRRSRWQAAGTKQEK